MTFNEQFPEFDNSGPADDYIDYAEWYSQANFDRPESTEDPADLIIRINEEQGLNINPAILENVSPDGDSNFDFGYQCRTATRVTQAVAVAANLLYDNPWQRLADKPMEITTNHPDFTERLALDTLARIVNGSITPEVDSQMSPYRFKDRNAPGVDVCELAEGRFKEVFKQIKDPELIIKGEIRLLGYRIITDGSKPIIVSKGRGALSSVSLVPVTVNGVTYPPGSLLNINTWDDFKNGQRRKDEISLPHKLDKEHILRARFIRLLDWAGDSQRLNDYRIAAQKVLPLVREPIMPYISPDKKDRILESL